MKGILKVKPNILIDAILLIQLALHICGEIFNWKSFFSTIYIIIAGSIIAVFGLAIHMRCHKYHKDGHKTSDEIENIVSSGIFSRVRHPMYLGLILITWGLYIAWNFIITVPIPIILSILMFYVAKKEEEFLIEKMGNSYLEYRNSVKWMFIPGII